MTDEQRAKRIHDITYSTDDRAELAERIVALEDENAKLREELEAVGTAAYLYGRNDLAAENAELRELVRGLNWCTESPDGPRVDCERCPLGVVDGEPLELMCEKMMRELGIEVD